VESRPAPTQPPKRSPRPVRDAINPEEGSRSSNCRRPSNLVDAGHAPFRPADWLRKLLQTATAPLKPHPSRDHQQASAQPTAQAPGRRGTTSSLVPVTGPGTIRAPPPRLPAAVHRRCSSVRLRRTRSICGEPSWPASFPPRRLAPRKLLARLLPPALDHLLVAVAPSILQGRGGCPGACGQTAGLRSSRDAHARSHGPPAHLNLPLRRLAPASLPPNCPDQGTHRPRPPSRRRRAGSAPCTRHSPRSTGASAIAVPAQSPADWLRDTALRTNLLPAQASATVGQLPIRPPARDRRP